MRIRPSNLRAVLSIVHRRGPCCRSVTSKAVDGNDETAEISIDLSVNCTVAQNGRPAGEEEDGGAAGVHFQTIELPFATQLKPKTGK